MPAKACWPYLPAPAERPATAAGKSGFTSGLPRSQRGPSVDRHCPVAAIQNLGSGNRESDQAGAKHDNADNGHGEEAVRSEFFTHGTPPVACPCAMERPPPRTVKDLSPTNFISIRDDTLKQHPFERRCEGTAARNCFATQRNRQVAYKRDKLLISLVSALGIEPRTP